MPYYVIYTIKTHLLKRKEKDKERAREFASQGLFSINTGWLPEVKM